MSCFTFNRLNFGSPLAAHPRVGVEAFRLYPCSVVLRNGLRMPLSAEIKGTCRLTEISCERVGFGLPYRAGLPNRYCALAPVTSTAHSCKNLARIPRKGGSR